MEKGERLRLRVSPQVAAQIGPGSSRTQRLEVAKARHPLPDLAYALVFLAFGQDEEIRKHALLTLKKLPVVHLHSLLSDEATPPKVLHLIVRLRYDDADCMASVIKNPGVSDRTLLFLAREAGEQTLSLLLEDEKYSVSAPGLLEAIADNPRAGKGIKDRISAGRGGESSLQAEKSAEHCEDDKSEGDKDRASEDSREDDISESSEINQSKYQMSLDLSVSEKIKMALTGDKEWRSILLRDANKLVSSAVLKNPRITDGEVLAVTRNRSASDDLIRIVLLNTEWVKNNEIKKALAIHPRTPLPKALRFMSAFTEKELKQLSKSRNVSQVIVNSARRMLMGKEKGR
ncbi:hypothetical protein [Geoalkalibacter subterraneus]|uniref:hypothetical protein n=1 Tax=Geoalkalibacter subterraneus TaxID=483547 RepID=UPI0006932165|nr:hypothetical protein [Geoalkalibacter subterraneus]